MFKKINSRTSLKVKWVLFFLSQNQFKTWIFLLLLLLMQDSQCSILLTSQIQVSHREVFEHFDNEILDKMTTVWSFGACKCVFLVLRRIVPREHGVLTVCVSANQRSI